MRWLPNLALTLVLAGCSMHQPLNPSFPLTADQAKAAWEDMERHPQELARPVIVLGGIYDPGMAAKHVADEIREIASADARVLHVSFIECGSFDGCARKLIEQVDAAFPSNDPHETIEVDVIGFSMGGLVARYTASEQCLNSHGRRLRIARLFTISSPHQGAKLAVVPTIDRRVVDMREDSAFLNRLNQESMPYELVAYARVGDHVVGEENAALPDQTPWWLSKSRGLSHAMAYHDRRILADIGRRLRGEPPFTIDPPAPLPPRRRLFDGVS